MCSTQHEGPHEDEANPRATQVARCAPSTRSPRLGARAGDGDGDATTPAKDQRRPRLAESSRQPQALPDLPSRRAALLALVLAGSTPRPPTAAAAFSLGIRTNTSLDSALVAARRRPCSHLFSSPVVLAVVVCWDAAAGPKELLREQKKKSARFLLAPIAASREILLKAQSLLGNSI